MNKSQLTSVPLKTQVVVLGPSGGGKTALVLRCLQRHFEADYEPTIEDVYSHAIQMPDGEEHEVLITDTAGSRRYPDLREESIRSADGFFIVFALNDIQSFLEAIEIWDEIKTLKGEKFPIVIVGNKTDLVNERQVFPPMVKEVINPCGGTSVYLETSAKLEKNIQQLFAVLIQLLHPTPGRN
ncbi:ras-related protein R-Ras [Nephila pilipes]|uniref:Ras-related protein R-Ras n=1 Tax=Nephila pilipes TaxID=299642 RepID=A0A8X6U4K6_NEPPI|nr:ras-related protein R-Ras [Nephila pilipes]